MEPPQGGDGAGTGAAHLARFNAFQLREIERALAEHLGVSAEHVGHGGFTVMPEGERVVRISWVGSAAIDRKLFLGIVEAATGDDDSASRRWRDRLPEAQGQQARPRGVGGRRRRSRPSEDSPT